jgi:AraC-like DNA-binding protein
MDKLPDLYFLTVFFAGILGFVVAGILVFVNRTDTFASRLLAGFLICFSLLALNFALMTTRFFFSYPHFWRVVGWASFCYSPLAYLYVRSVLNQSFTFKKFDFLFFLPAVIHTIGLIPFYIQPASEKVIHFYRILEDPKLITSEPESVFPDKLPAIARIVLGVFTTAGQFLLLAKWKKKHAEHLGIVQQNIDTFRWLSLFTSIMAIFYGAIIIEFVFQFGSSSDLTNTLIITISGTILFVSLYLMMKPSILYGMKGWQKPSTVVLPANDPIDKKQVVDTKRYFLSSEQGIAFKRAIETHFDQNNPFRKHGYTIGDLSKEVDIPAYQLSTFINQEYAMNFNELINSYRVDYLIQRYSNTHDFAQFTLEALGKEAGFNSRAAFISAVKKRTGKPPSEIFGRRGDKTLS